MTEEQLSELFDFATGNGKFYWTGKRMMTHPGTGDINQQGLHDGCEELERRGLLRRFREEPGLVVWGKNMGIIDCTNQLLAAVIAGDGKYIKNGMLIFDMVQITKSNVSLFNGGDKLLTIDIDPAANLDYGGCIVFRVAKGEMGISLS